MARKPKQLKTAKGKAGKRRLVRIREYARLAGVSAPTIVKAIREGKIKPAAHDKTGPLIDVEDADRTWKNAPRKRRRAMQLVGIPVDPDNPDAAPDLESDADAPGQPAAGKDGKPKIPNYFRSKAAKEHYAAERSRLAYEEALGRLVDADKVKREAFLLARKARDRIVAIPDRVAAILAAESDVDRVHIILTRELTDVCREIAADVQPEEEESEE